MLIAVIFLAQIFIPFPPAEAWSSYKKLESCKEQTCSYDYILSGEMHNKHNKEGLETSAIVTLRCESVGFYDGDNVQYYCFDIKDAEVQIFEVTINQTGNGNETIKRVKTKADMNYLMKNKFCFVRNANGKIPSVFHPIDEKTDIVNFKKTIASTFQANFAKTQAQEESDSQSNHKSHYTYTEEGDKTIEHRYVNKKDVSQYSGKESNKASIDYQSAEDIEIDEDKTIRYSHGESSTSLSSTSVEDEEESDGEEKQDIPPIETKSTYTLRLRECGVVNSIERQWKGEVVEDTLIARLDEKKHDRLEMQNIYVELPDLEDSARRATRSTDENETRKVLDSHLAKWRRILFLESQHGALGGRKTKIHYLRNLLEKHLMKQQSDAHKHLRLMLYSLLSYEGSLLSQQGLLNALQVITDMEEYQNIVISIAMLTSVESSTVSQLESYVLSETGTLDEQLLLAFATLGRHKNVANKVVNTITEMLPSSSNDTTRLFFLIHALGNTGSNLIIPHVSPFLFSLNDDVQLTAIDALRTVSTHETVQKLFSEVIEELSIDAYFAIVESLNFPYESHRYYPDIVKPSEREDNQQQLTAIEEELMEKIANATIEFDNLELFSATKKYLKYYGTDHALGLLKTLNAHYQQQNASERAKRSFTRNWSDSSDSSYDLIASKNSRATDKQNYPYNKAFLWAKQLGPSKIHAKLAVGGFSGFGTKGSKIYAKAVIKLYAYSRTYEAVKLEYQNTMSFTGKPYSYRFAKIGGSTLVSQSGTTPERRWSWSRSMSTKIFSVQYSIFVWIGYLSFYIEGNINIDTSFLMKLNVEGKEVSTEASLGPSFTITGGTSLTLLVIYRVGLEITANIGYYITPKASATLCDSDPVADGTACLGVYHGSNGIKVDIYAFYQKRICRVRNWRYHCDWNGKTKLSSFSSTYSIGFLRQSLLWGQCAICHCSDPIHQSCLDSRRAGSAVASLQQGSCSCRGSGYSYAY